MPRHRSSRPAGLRDKPTAPTASTYSDGVPALVVSSRRGPTPNLRAAAVVVGVAAGAGAAALQVLTEPPVTHHEPRITLLAMDADDPSGRSGVGGDGTGAGVFLSPQTMPPQDEAAQLKAAKQVSNERIAREAEERRQREREAAEAKKRQEREAAEEAARGRVVAPVQGRITSNYGPRWGATHYGLDIANEIGTPIRAAMTGVVLDAGPASGFGLWVRLQHEDGSVTVYGHINSYSVSVGERVEAGDVIAEVGNRGRSTGPHLHFEVWGPSGKKLNPLAWLREAGADI